MDVWTGGSQIGNSSVYRIQQNRCVPSLLSEAEGRSILQNVVIFKVLRYLRLLKSRRGAAVAQAV
jgi:hypothetical protein